MARLVHGPFMDDHAVMACHISGNSPLVWDATMLEGLRVYAKAGQVVLMSPFVLGAGNTPADVAATVAQLNAEALAGLACAQLVRPGTRVIHGQYTVSVLMKSGRPMSGMPEVTLMNVIIGQLARRFGLPVDHTGDDLFSTVKRQARIPMWVVHPRGSPAGVWRSQPKPVPGEQPPETSQPKAVRRVSQRRTESSAPRPSASRRTAARPCGGGQLSASGCGNTSRSAAPAAGPERCGPVPARDPP